MAWVGPSTPGLRSARTASSTRFLERAARFGVVSKIYVDRPPTAVWRAFVDLESWSKWSPICTDCRVVDGTSFLEGAVLAMRLDFRIWKTEVRAQLVRVRPHHQLRWRTRVLGARVQHTYTLEPLGHGSLVSNEEVFVGLGPLLRIVVRAWFRKTNLSFGSLSGIKKLVEGEGER